MIPIYGGVDKNGKVGRRPAVSGATCLIIYINVL